MYEEQIPQQRERLDSLAGTRIFRGERRIIVPSHLMPDPGNERYPGEALKALRRGDYSPQPGQSWRTGIRTNLDNMSVGTHWSTNRNTSMDNFAWLSGNQEGIPASSQDRRKMMRGWKNRTTDETDPDFIGLPPHLTGSKISYLDDDLSPNRTWRENTFDAKPFLGRFIWHATITDPESQVDTESPWTKYESEINLKDRATVPVHAVSYSIAPSGESHHRKLSTVQFSEPIQMPIRLRGF